MIEAWAWITGAIGAVLLTILGSQVIYLFVFSVSGKFYKEKSPVLPGKFNRFVIYIPAYKEDAVILNTAREVLLLDYPKELFHVIVIADSLKKSTLEKLAAMPLQLVEVEFEKSTKAKALNKAIEKTAGSFDNAIVFDADNIAKPDYLNRMNEAFNKGYGVVQGHRTAKNQDTPMAILDAISEGINNHIFRKGHRVLGFSSAIIGSGMGLEFYLFKEVMDRITAIGGFDKEMELILLKGRRRIAYANNAILYDEKVQKAEVFEKQRKRWLSAQLNYLKKHALSGFVELIARGNLDYFDKVLQMALIPRVLLLAILPVVFLASLLPGNAPPPIYWAAIWIIGYVAIALAVPTAFLNKKFLKALANLPQGIFSTFKVLFKLKGANKSFIHTPHGETQENNKQLNV
jgi:cellulose synthase/poly-beta-1,6-N-acetylglucosamine synthase-like glycosyltransferase